MHPRSRALRPRSALKTYTEPSLRAKLRRPRSPPKSARRRSVAPPGPPSATLLSRAVAAAQALTARARLHLSPPSPPMQRMAAEGDADAPTPRDGPGSSAPPPSPTPQADSAASSDSGAGSDGEEARRALSFDRGQVRHAAAQPPCWC